MAESFHLVQLSYVSRATVEPREEELFALLEQSRLRNRQDDITGLLLYCRGNFLQVIEGPEPPMEALWGRLRRDHRHHEVELLYRTRTSTREFGGWSMAFERVLQPRDVPVPAFSELLEQLNRNEQPQLGSRAARDAVRALVRRIEGGDFRPAQAG